MAIRLPDWSDGPVDVMMGDVRDRLCDLADESVQCVVTSPPYWGLRDYKAPGQIGLEPIPSEYIERLVDVFHGVRRVLRRNGTLWLNLGDSYAASPKGNLNGQDKSTLTSTRTQESSPTGINKVSGKLKPKDLVGIPWMAAFALREAGWWLRSDIVWSKPNPMPESVQDRPTTAHEHLFLLSKAERYYYDADAIRLPPTQYAGDLGIFRSQKIRAFEMGRKPSGNEALARGNRKDKQRGHSRRHAGFNDRWDLMSREEQQLAGANARSVWEIATQPYPEAHFATFPEALVEPCILAGSAEGDTVLDPFAGSGTTLAVARRLGRKAIGIELQPDYLPLIQKRVTEAAMPLLEAIEST